MKLNYIFKEFEKLAEQLEIRIIIGKGNFSGDYCQLEKDRYIVLNKNKPLEQKIKRLSVAFSQIDLSNIYIKPAVRELIDAEKQEILFE